MNFFVAIKQMGVGTALFLLFLATPGHSQVPKWAWARQSDFGNSSQEALAVACDRYGNVYTLGHTSGKTMYGTTVIDSGSFLVKHDKSGNFKWVKCLPELPSAIGVDSKSNLYVAGNFYSIAVFNGFTLTTKGNSDIFLAKYDRGGSLIRCESFGGKRYDYCNALSVDKEDNILITGGFTDTIAFQNNLLIRPLGVQFGNASRFFIAKFTSAGLFAWADAGAPDRDKKFGYLISTDKLNNAYVIGESLYPPCEMCYEGYFIHKYSPVGNVLMDKDIWDYTEMPNGLAVDDSLNIFTVYSTGSHYMFSPQLVKYSNNMLLVRWIQQELGAGYDNYLIYAGLSLDSSGAVFLSGLFGPSGYGQFDSVGFGGHYLHSRGGTDLAICKYRNSDGAYEWIKVAGGRGNEANSTPFYSKGCINLCADRAGNCYVASTMHLPYSSNYPGPAKDSCFFDSAFVFNRDTLPTLFTAKLIGSKYEFPVENPLGVESGSDKGSQVRVFPNPTRGLLSIKPKTGNSICRISIKDLYGKEVYFLVSQGQREQNLDLEELLISRGAYILEVTTNDYIQRSIILFQ
jgi:hypothetical protein